MSNKLPPLSGPVDASGAPACSVCQVRTLYACADCRIDFGVSIPVCSKPTCRDEHEQKCSARLRERLAAAAVPSSPAQADLVRALHTVAMTIADALSGKAVDFREALRLIHDMQLEARDGSLTLSALPPSSPVADSPTEDYQAACEVLPDSLGRPLAARIQLVLDNLRRESHIGCELRRELDGGIERDAKAIEERWPDAAAHLRSHAHIEDGV